MATNSLLLKVARGLQYRDLPHVVCANLTTPYEISRSLGVEDEFVWNLLREADGNEFTEIAQRAFRFYAEDDN